MLKTMLCAAALLCGAAALAQEEPVDYIPKINGTIRAKYEYEPEISAGRFEIRNARVSVTGNILRNLVYKAEIDLSDEGKIKMLDAYVRFQPHRWTVTAGQMRVPFTIDVPRSPHTQYFANRSFLAKQIANIRDVGLAASFDINPGFPWTVSAGIFNGSGLTDQKDFWTKSYYFTFKTYATLAKYFTLEFSAMRIKPDNTAIMMWDAGAYFDNGPWHIEAEYLRKNYSHGAFPGVNVVNAFACRTFPIRKAKALNGISALVRYDYMSDHSNGVANEDGKLTITDDQRQRITAGATLHFGIKRVYAQIRLNYEKYFYKKGVEIGISGHDKLVAEIMVHF